ncbi:hypothetical protein N9N67_11900, partial [Bacteriovoracaceae bacterium]|nr:hypothetical protein [Bacteriovoracaceae bacterium]
MKALLIITILMNVALAAPLRYQLDLPQTDKKSVAGFTESDIYICGLPPELSIDSTEVLTHEFMNIMFEQFIFFRKKFNEQDQEIDTDLSSNYSGTPRIYNFMVNEKLEGFYWPIRYHVSFKLYGSTKA